MAIALCSCHGVSDRDEPRSKSGLEWPRGSLRWQEVHYGVLQVDLPTIAGAEYINDNDLCMTCHEGYVRSFQHNVHRDLKCESCHGPASRHMETRGTEPGLIFSFKMLGAAERSELCLKCHETPHGGETWWRESAHAHKGVSCSDCHTSHYNVPPGTKATEVASRDSDSTSNAIGPLVVRAQEPEATASSLRGTSNNLHAVAPQVCYRCHAEKQDLERVAHPHQIGGPNCFNCTTCHSPNAKILESTRKDNCLQCHTGTPTMAWHSSTHNQFEVACADCHNAHPSSNVPSIVTINHTHIARPERLPMSVDQPEACYKCHQKIYGLTALPSHHPIKEGKLECSDCHDGHGQHPGNLNAETVNLVCLKCHAEKQGPFVYEHPPVTESCLICHEPHGTIENNLLRQPTTFLCLRCHAGHRGVRRPIDVDPTEQSALYTNCSLCHQQIHGSDLPAATGTPRFTR